jgi:hypothetical protein
VNWRTPRNDPTWCSISEHDYYRIAAPEPPAVVEYGAYFVEALWATPTEIGRASTIKAAQKICEEHSTRPSAA